MTYKSFATTLFALAAVLLIAAGALPAGSRVQVLVNGKPVVSDVPPMLINGVTYLPLRATAEALGAEVEWQESTKTATLCGKDICYPVHTADPASGVKIVKNRILLPLRKAAETLGATVVWNEKARRVEITK